MHVLTAPLADVLIASIPHTHDSSWFDSEKRIPEGIVGLSWEFP